ncbi:single-stranded DNA-binding protein [Burkholderia stagnalis]|uniref:single-stranded DNA-binding protein n=1 Tax=Burkholderia stagnalis TaxID=1503054 RepID=UPI000F5BE8CC|nr:single-stranded DNA-binding protein [Burkholderia stagnalis]RQP98066.1 single-stranded DNA-binding protein [Burkholderia stagnalis]RQY68848.1 single-stranded DNA-binding protein [Burkholderia stagnalis]
MIDALIAGKLVGAAVERTSSSGKTFVTCKVRAADSDGEGQFVNVVAFDSDAKAVLLVLGDGESVSLSGSLKVGTYEARDGSIRVSINLVASAVLTPYHVRRRREAIAQASGRTQATTGISGAAKRRELCDAEAGAGDSMQDDEVAF